MKTIITLSAVLIVAIAGFGFSTNSLMYQITPHHMNIDNADTIFQFDNSSQEELNFNWSVALTGHGKMCLWEIKNESSNKILAQTSEETNDYRFNIITNNNLYYKDLQIDLRFKGVAGNNDQGGGPVWRYQDADNYYVARANPLENNFRVYKVVKGKRLELNSANLRIDSNKWYDIKIRMKGNKIKCYFNDKLELEVEDNTFCNSGKIGLWTKSDAVTFFDDVKIHSF
jgi:hypothetical protein